MPPGHYRRYWAPGNFLNGQVEDIPFDGGEMPFSKKDLPGSYLLDLSGVPKRIFAVEDPESKRKMELDFSQSPYLTIWSDLGQFVCVEPCWGLPDSVPQTAFENKIGIQVIAPLAKLKGSVTLRPTFLS
jgi:galactose mutarotase-like enzyme